MHCLFLHMMYKIIGKNSFVCLFVSLESVWWYTIKWVTVLTLPVPPNDVENKWKKQFVCCLLYPWNQLLLLHPRMVVWKVLHEIMERYVWSIQSPNDMKQKVLLYAPSDSSNDVQNNWRKQFLFICFLYLCNQVFHCNPEWWSGKCCMK